MVIRIPLPLHASSTNSFNWLTKNADHHNHHWSRHARHTRTFVHEHIWVERMRIKRNTEKMENALFVCTKKTFFSLQTVEGRKERKKVRKEWITTSYIYEMDIDFSHTCEMSVYPLVLHICTWKKGKNLTWCWRMEICT